MPHEYDTASAVRASRGTGEDRVAVLSLPEGVAIAVADGAGGIGGGREAAEQALAIFALAVGERAPARAADWTSLLSDIDTKLARGRGQCCLVGAWIADNKIVGASVGDCAAWLIGETILDLTQDQIRKPLLGSGDAAPISFAGELSNATLLLATDGLTKYASRILVSQLAKTAEIISAATSLAELPRLKSGELPDDVGVALCRRARRGATRLIDSFASKP
jgi:serine/threonine protein phosphatase PrpC